MAGKETVSVKTFKKWPFSKYFDNKLDDANRIEEIKCIACSQKWSEIVAESKKRQLRGSVLCNIMEYVLLNYYTYPGSRAMIFFNPCIVLNR